MGVEAFGMVGVVIDEVDQSALWNMAERLRGYLRPKHGGVLCTHGHHGELVAAAWGSERCILPTGFFHMDCEECVFDICYGPIARATGMMQHICHVWHWEMVLLCDGINGLEIVGQTVPCGDACMILRLKHFRDSVGAPFGDVFGDAIMVRDKAQVGVILGIAVFEFAVVSVQVKTQPKCFYE